mmetsp:Transcript_29557/g.54160  ORF Transcript_29557/g.54160 Transcript_29557/m.54160 type:complete len:362 (+) Transcript_29557:2016-3101(+)
MSGGAAVKQSAKSSINTPEGRSSPRSDHVVRNSLIAGSAAGITSTLAFYPLDVLRTKMQSSPLALASATTSSVSNGGKTGMLTASGLQRGSSSAAMGPRQVLAHTLQHGGYRALYTGLSLPLAAQAVYKGTVFTVNNVTKKALVEWKSQEQFKLGLFTSYKMTLQDTLFCGAMAGAFNAACFVTPVEFIRNQLIAQHTRIAQETSGNVTVNKNRVLFRGPMDVIRSTIKTDGIFGLWRGAGVTVARDGIGCGLFFFSFEVAKNQLAPFTGGKDSPLTTLLAGAVAGLGFWSGALPLDTIKTWIQTGEAQSIGDALSTHIRKDGIVNTVRTTFRGWQVAFGRGAPAAAVTIGTYEFCSRLLI